jgi:hypothetical protein
VPVILLPPGQLLSARQGRVGKLAARRGKADGGAGRRRRRRACASGDDEPRRRPSRALDGKSTAESAHARVGEAGGEHGWAGKSEEVGAGGRQGNRGGLYSLGSMREIGSVSFLLRGCARTYERAPVHPLDESYS